MKKYIAFILCINLFTACSKDEYNECLEDKFDTFKSSATCADSSIDEYTFQGKSVYVLSGQNCFADGGSSVLAEDCTELGTLGTIVGITEINGVDFSKNAVLVKNIWKKN